MDGRGRCRVADSHHPRFRLCTAHARRHVRRKKRRLAAEAEEGSRSHKRRRRVAEHCTPPASSAVQLWLQRLASAEPFVEKKACVRMLQHYGAAFRVLEGCRLVFKEWRGGQESADRPACESCYGEQNLATVATVRQGREWPTLCARHATLTDLLTRPSVPAESAKTEGQQKTGAEEREGDTPNLRPAKKKSLTCAQCDKRFTQAGTLKTHLRTHIGHAPEVDHPVGATSPVRGTERSGASRCQPGPNAPGALGQRINFQQGGRNYQLRVSAGGALFSSVSKPPHGWTQWCLACASCWHNTKTVARGAHWAGDGARRRFKLCAKHARAHGCHKLRNPCEDCPAGSKKQACFANDQGQPNRLCADHARARGCHQTLRPCADCPVGSKKEAGFADEQGRLNRLCADHARVRGCHRPQNPCEDCPTETKKEAKFADEQGRSRRLCSVHAFARGLIPKPAAGCSIVACRLWDRLEQALGCRIQHRHFLDGGDTPQGSEFGVPGTQLRLDGYDAVGNCVYEFHGNAYHGFPPGHPKYAEGRSRVSERRNRDLYRETMARMYFIRQKMPAGCRVFYAWEHEYARIKDKPLASAASILYELPPGEDYEEEDDCWDEAGSEEG